jgi:DNA-binding transcriptional LysR family regulator
MEARIRWYASRGYIEANGMPRTPEEMASHRLVTQSPASHQVRAGADFVAPFLSGNRSALTVNNYFGILQGVVHGLGIGSLPDYLATDFPDIVRVLPEAQSAPIPVYLAYVEELRHSKRVCAFRDFMLEEIAAFRRQAEPPAEAVPSHAVAP